VQGEFTSGPVTIFKTEISPLDEKRKESCCCCYYYRLVCSVEEAKKRKKEKGSGFYGNQTNDFIDIRRLCSPASFFSCCLFIWNRLERKKGA
jgi:hypothetical protein